MQNWQHDQQEKAGMGGLSIFSTFGATISDFYCKIIRGYTDTSEGMRTRLITLGRNVLLFKFGKVVLGYLKGSLYSSFCSWIIQWKV